MNALLEAENKKLLAERTLLEEGREELKTDRDRLSDDSKHLTKELDTLLVQQKLLKRVVSGLNIAVDQAAKGGSSFFSILNNGDPINKLQDSYGWKMWSDNYFGWLGYYIVMQHPDVIQGGRVFVGRVMEMEALKRDRPDTWRKEVARMNEQGPIIILDYTYFALLVDDQALVGGEVYKNEGDIVEFHAPLSDWAKELDSLLSAYSGTLDKEKTS
ncbi:hypothetical protein [uncultured Desulfobulbus sp.]|uniref:hypothetical protein n=1 Tax=uncultured Desulfobulbus sp. TaxID=239745 RepID=UPI0029C64873|nr:hypothetical protein [uncultured Desulfobulbus sp.]